MKEFKNIKTLGQLKAVGFKSRSIKEELRENLIDRLKNKQNVFEGIWGYEETVIPDLERAILAGHDPGITGTGQNPSRTIDDQATR
jgi:magnesium chelatase subunit I